jgi:hypothetical protein
MTRPRLLPPLAPASLLVTALVAAIAGLASLVVVPAAPAPAPAPAGDPALTAGAVVVDDEGLALALRPVVPLQALGQPILLDLLVHNRSSRPVSLPPDLTLELSVRHESLAAGESTSDGESALLVLDLVLGEGSGSLAPGESYVQRVTLAAGPPFERPGRYLMTTQPGAAGASAADPSLRILLCEPLAGTCETGEA